MFSLLIIIFDARESCLFIHIITCFSKLCYILLILSFIELLHSEEDDDYLLRGPCVILPFDSHSRAIIKVNISIFNKSVFVNCFAEQNQTSSKNIYLSVKHSSKKCCLGSFVIFTLALRALQELSFRLRMPTRNRSFVIYRLGERRAVRRGGLVVF